MITYKDIQKNKEINAMIEQGNQVLKTLGYTEHSKKHALKVAEYAAEILKITGADAHQIELAQIAGYMHDIGNQSTGSCPQWGYFDLFHFERVGYAAFRSIDNRDSNWSS